MPCDFGIAKVSRSVRAGVEEPGNTSCLPFAIVTSCLLFCAPRVPAAGRQFFNSATGTPPTLEDFSLSCAVRYSARSTPRWGIGARMPLLDPRKNLSDTRDHRD